MVIWIFRHHLSVALLIPWGVVQAGIIIGRYLNAKAFRKHLKNNDQNGIDFQTKVLLVLMISSAAWWNIILIGGASYAPPAYDFFSIIVVLGLMTGALLSLSAVVHIYFIFSFLLFIPQIIFFSQLGGEIRLSVMLLGVIYIPYVYSLSMASHNSLKASIRAGEQLRASVEELHTISTTDPLTGIHNRRYFFAICQNLIDLSVREKCDISILMLDIDFFKKVNDTHGHHAGDYILTELTTAIKPLVRKSDVFARMGGEEFSILLYDASRPNALKIAQKICTIIENTRFNYKDISIPITLSIGVASMDSEHNTLDQLLATADKNLYAAKHNGRNCCVA